MRFKGIFGWAMGSYVLLYIFSQDGKGDGVPYFMLIWAFWTLLCVYKGTEPPEEEK